MVRYPMDCICIMLEETLHVLLYIKQVTVVSCGLSTYNVRLHVIL